MIRADEVAGELDPILHNGRYSLLSNTIVEFHGEHAGPVATVLNYLGKAIAEDESQETRSTLSLEAEKRWSAHWNIKISGLAPMRRRVLWLKRGMAS